jgi:polyisoprenoid-binding protein YceI
MFQPIALILFALLIASCSNKLSNQVTRSTNPVTAQTSGDTLRLDLNQSVVRWTGTALGDMSKHTGTVKLSSGYLLMNGEQIVGGNFVMDMLSFEPTDIRSEKMKRKFIKHMRSDDFFNTELYPTSTFTITDATKDSVSGNFTLRDITKNIKFRYSWRPSVYMREVATARFVINKNDWSVPYKRVNDLVEIEVGLVQKDR